MMQKSVKNKIFDNRRHFYILVIIISFRFAITHTYTNIEIYNRFYVANNKIVFIFATVKQRKTRETEKNS